MSTVQQWDGLPCHIKLELTGGQTLLTGVLVKTGTSTQYCFCHLGGPYLCAEEISNTDFQGRRLDLRGAKDNSHCSSVPIWP